MKWAISSLFLLLPLITNANIYISEIAWMGSTESANHEWIELRNDGEAQDVSGWQVTDGNNFSIDLSGTVAANTFALLERNRSDGGSVGSPFLTYTGALVNSGATLRLVRSDGSVADQVSGGENWQNIGGDNKSKNTAQYTNQGWITAQPTPGKTNQTTGVVDTTNTANTSNTTQTESVTDDNDNTQSNAQASQPTVVTNTVKKSSSGGGNALILTLPDVTLDLGIKALSFGYVNQPIKFAVEPSGIGDTLIDSLKYSWNFGDGNTSNQKAPEHVFAYPGTYAVTVYAGFKRQEQVVKHEITILPVELSLTKNSVGDIQINNDSPYEIDISGYKLKGNKSFVFPAYSILLPKQTITIPHHKIGVTTDNLIAIYDNESVVLAAIIPEALQASAEPEIEVFAKPKPAISSINSSSPIGSVEDDRFNFGLPAETKEEVATKPAMVNQVASVASSSRLEPNRFYYLGLVGIILLGIVSLYAGGGRREIE